MTFHIAAVDKASKSRRIARRALPVLSALVFAGLAAAPAHADIRPGMLRCEYKTDPLAVESAHPRLFWNLSGSGRGEKQTAYQVLVASSREKLAANTGDLWDSGKVTSSETIQIPYNGKPLLSGQQVFWKVQVWDAKSKATWSAPASWTMGLLQPKDWTAKWISGPDASESAPVLFSDAKWIWHDSDGASPGVGKRFLRRTITIPADAKISSARLSLTADDRYTVRVNDNPIHTGPTNTDSWRQFQTYDIARELRPGANTVVIEASNLVAGPAGVLAHLTIAMPGTTLSLNTDNTWESGTSQDGPFAPVRVVGNYGVAPWGTIGGGNRLPPPYFRKNFQAAKPIKRALLYATALGVYDLSLNGKTVSRELLSPGWSDYRKRVHYLAYDVTPLMKPGDNALGAVLGDGWYASYLAFTGRHHFYGGETKLRLQLHVEYADGTQATLGTDDSWKTSYGPITAADMLMGSTRDTRREMTGWDTTTFNDAGWKPALVQPSPDIIVDAHPGEPIRPTQTLAVQKRTSPKPGVYLYNFNQNLVGYVRLTVNGKPGQKVVVRHGEFLNPDGTLYTTNLRAAQATDTYILKGGPQVLEPSFTFHGFQYAEITGLDAPLEPKDVTGVVFHSDLKSTLAFDSDNPLLNRLIANIDWGQRGNFLDVPTDCPQRDERAGWMGDAQVFAKTSMFHRDASSFYTKWLDDVDDGQFPDGSYPDVAPSILGGGNAAWEDAMVISAYRMYEMYGDTALIAEHWPGMTRYMEHLAKVAPNGLRGDGAYGDWLLLDGPQHSEINGTAYYYRCAQLMAIMADAIGKRDEATQYRAVADKVKAAFVAAFVTDDGKVADKGRESQTFYALALDWNLVPDAKRTQAAANLRRMLQQRGDHLATGFIGTPVLLTALASSGQAPVANKLILTETYPSWLYQVKLGATTMWERWDGWTPEKGFQDAGMNSFNHYWLGCVGEWIYTGVAGIDTDGPGWRKIILHPQVDSSLNKVNCSYDSIRGRITSSWAKEKDGSLSLNVVVPANVTATVYVPTTDVARVRESGKPVTQVGGITLVRQEPNAAVLSIGSGTYKFRVAPR